jgi:hypothetical protein
MKDNPFERYDIDPRLGTSEITARFRELMEDAKTEDEKADLRATWEALTLHSRDRLIAALSTWPETREEIPLGVDDDPMPSAPPIAVDDLGLLDLLAPRTIASALTRPEEKDDRDESLADDPLLNFPA